MEISNCWKEDLNKPGLYVKPYAINYTQNNKLICSENLKIHDDVSILIYNRERKVFILVRQFRVAVFVHSADGGNISKRNDDLESYSTGSGMTWELCAGIIDRDEAPIKIAIEEVWEETGYKITENDIQFINVVVNETGNTGSKNYTYYAEVTDAMKEGEGGGLAEEGEIIEVVEIHKHDALNFALDETKPKPADCSMAIMWWLSHQHYSLSALATLQGGVPCTSRED